MKILVIEDNPLVAETLVEILTHQTYAVETARDGWLGWDLLKTYEYDLVILDLLLPRINGLELCRKLRNADNPVPILMLTGRSNPQDKVIGLDAGADDYLVKPFDSDELLARVRVLLRRNRETSHTQLSWGDLQLDPVICQVSYQTQPIALTPKEYALTELLIRNPKRIFSCSAILDHLWTYEEAPGEEAVRTHIKGLRQKLKAASQGVDLVETIYGIGYRLRTMPQSAPGTDSQQTGAKPASTQQSIAVSDSPVLQRKLEQIWQESQPGIQRQLDRIHQALIAHANQQVSAELHNQTLQEAHTLAGTLGTFGLPQGSHLAQAIETQLKSTTVLTPNQLNQLQTDFATLQQILSDTQSSTIGQSMEAAKRFTLRFSLLVIDPNTQVIQKLLQDDHFQTVQVSLTKHLTQARSKIQATVPDVVLFDPDVAGSLEEGVRFLKQLHQSFPTLPIVTFTKHSELLERQTLLKSGGRVFLRKPDQPDQIKSELIWQALQQAMDQKATNPDAGLQVLVVDDDPTILALTQHLLQPWGLQVKTLANPQQFWVTLERVQPNLLILDIMMPGVSGLELCEMVRNDARWSELPILFLTGSNDATIINQVFSLGADDFVPKPIVGPELVTRVINRLERTKLLQQRYRALPTP